MSGPGSVQLGFLDASPSDPVTLTTTGTTARTTLALRAAQGTFTLADVDVAGLLNGLTAPTATLAGAVDVTKTLRAVTLGNVTGAPSTITGGGGGAATAYKVGAVNGLTITSAAPIASLAATNWTGGGLTAPSAGSVRVTGGLSGAAFHLTGGGIPLRSLMVGGAVTGSQLRMSAGSIGTVVVGGMSGSDLTAGAAAGATPLAGRTFATQASIGSFSEKARKAVVNRLTYGRLAKPIGSLPDAISRVRKAG